MRTYRLLWLGLLACAGLLFLSRRSGEGSSLRLEERVVMLVLALGLAAYVVSIGGDPRHYRYLAFPFCIAVCATGGLATPVLRRLGIAGAAVVLPLGLGLLSVSAAFHPPQLSRHPFTHREEHTRIGHINDPSKHRHKPELQHGAWITRGNPQGMRRFRDSGGRYDMSETATEWWCHLVYEHYDRWVVHALGLTDGFLARTPMAFERPAHKWGLYPLAVDLVRMYRSGIEPRPGAFARYVETGRAPAWMGENLGALEVIERKVWNRHDPIENLRLAFTRVPEIRVPQQPEYRPWQQPELVEEFGLAQEGR